MIAEATDCHAKEHKGPTKKKYSKKYSKRHRDTGITREKQQENLKITAGILKRVSSCPKTKIEAL